MEIPDPRVRIGQAETPPQIPVCVGFLPVSPDPPPDLLEVLSPLPAAGHREEALIPQKRGPKWKSRQVSGSSERQILQHRQKGINRYEICQLLAPTLQHRTPSPSTVYRVSRRQGLNRLTPKAQQEKRRIVKQQAGELGHLDCHHLSTDLIAPDPTRYYLVCARCLYPPGLGRGGDRCEEPDGHVQCPEELQSAPPALSAPVCRGLNGQWLGVRGAHPAHDPPV